MSNGPCPLPVSYVAFVTYIYVKPVWGHISLMDPVNMYEKRHEKQDILKLLLNQEEYNPKRFTCIELEISIYHKYQESGSKFYIQKSTPLSWECSQILIAWTPST